MQTIIDLKAVTLKFKKNNHNALKHITFSVKKGECIAITGVSGSGKTSLCQLLNGLIPQAIEGTLTGDINVAGKDVSRFRVQTMAVDIGIVLQDPEVQIVGRTVFEDIAFGLRNYLVPKTEIEKQVPEVLNLVGLQGFENRSCDTLSGGEKQRLAIAGILATQPKILVLDEPTSELDPLGKDKIYQLLRELRKKSKLTIIIVERLIETFTDLVDRILLLDNGEVIWFGPPQKLPKSAAIYDIKSSRNTHLTNKSNTHNEPKARVFSIKNFQFGYHKDQPILNNISMDIHANDYLAIVGHNGAGKTSLVRHLNGLLRPGPNQIFFKGQDVSNIKKRQLVQSVGLVFQNPDHQLFESSVEKEIAFGLKNTNTPVETAKLIVKKILRETGLDTFKHLHPHTLSKGTKQLIAIASMMVMKPEVLIIDEPTTGLDINGIKMVMRLLDNLHKNGTIIVLISHDLELVKRYTRRTIVLHQGRITADASTSQIFNQPTILSDAALIPKIKQVVLHDNES